MEKLKKHQLPTDTPDGVNRPKNSRRSLPSSIENHSGLKEGESYWLTQEEIDSMMKEFREDHKWMNEHWDEIN